ncbi:hypothetical protein N825_02120 [Skermanella stibiiresistens SB22]|uniref:DUF2264 domain-containing protein n=2 Tax=Skermanella TaxID=204447 RepID=W9HD93_9PROT|nr:hypothetical protein N825_02120 [Skermanella stibiiresistens SB22]
MSTIVFVAFFGLYVAFLNIYSTSGWMSYEDADQEPTSRDLAVRTAFLNGDASVEERYDALFRYFLRGYMENVSDAGERVQYPGAPSAAGYEINGLEGYARTAILFAAWIHSGRDPVVSLGGEFGDVDLVRTVRDGLLAGTDPESEVFWGEPANFNQRTVEAADIARILWLTRSAIWDRLSDAERDQIGAWLAGFITVKVRDNNWHFFPLIVGMVLKDLGVQGVEVPTRHYQDFIAHYRGHGWFFDNPEGIDYYNAWGVSYELAWIRMIDPAFDADFIGQALEASTSNILHLISPKGIPIMGRSVCYRTAVPAPIVAEASAAGGHVDPGLARRALDAVWRHFVERGALADGQLTQGYYGDDLRFLDPYSGTGSCHWGLRSLVMAYVQPPDSPFWNAAARSLPVEVADYDLDLPKVGWRISGRRETGDITIEIPANADKRYPIAAHSLRMRVMENLAMRLFRPYNHAVKYDERFYSTAEPFPVRR